MLVSSFLPSLEWQQAAWRCARSPGCMASVTSWMVQASTYWPDHIPAQPRILIRSVDLSTKTPPVFEKVTSARGCTQVWPEFLIYSLTRAVCTRSKELRDVKSNCSSESVLWSCGEVCCNESRFCLTHQKQTSTIGATEGRCGILGKGISWLQIDGLHLASLEFLRSRVSQNKRGKLIG